MRFFGEKKRDPDSPLDYPNGNGYHDDVPVTDGYEDDLHVQCPPHTTEQKLVQRIDLRVMPCLCIMYRTFSDVLKIECSS